MPCKIDGRFHIGYRISLFFYITCKLGIVRAPGKYEERYWIVLNRAKDDEPLRKRSALDTADKAWISYGCKSHWKKMAQALAAQRNDRVAAKLVYRPCGETKAMRTVLGSSFCPTVWKPHSPLFFLLWVFFALKNVSCCPAKNKIKNNLSTPSHMNRWMILVEAGRTRDGGFSKDPPFEGKWWVVWTSAAQCAKIIFWVMSFTVTSLVFNWEHRVWWTRNCLPCSILFLPRVPMLIKPGYCAPLASPRR